MARNLRISFPGAVYHVMNRGVEGRDIFLDEKDKAKRSDLLKKTVELYDLRLYAYVLMDNHDHFFFRTPKANISKAMHYFNTTYCGWFNRRHFRKGPLFQDRYRTQLVEEGSHFIEMTRYIHLNPVRAGIVDRPEDYQWSSYRGYVEKRLRFPWVRYKSVLQEISLDEELALAEYIRFVNGPIVELERVGSGEVNRRLGGKSGVGGGDQVTKKKPLLPFSSPDPAKISRARFFGSAEFREAMKERFEKKLSVEEEKVELNEIARRMSKITGVKIPDWGKVGRDDGLLRPLLAWAACRVFYYNYAEIASWLGLKNKTSVGKAVKKAESKIDNLEWIKEKLTG